MLLLKLLAAFWAAENMDEKKLDPELLLPGIGSSVVGVKGNEKTLESLLGPTAADADELLLWTDQAREEGGPSAIGAGLETFLGDQLPDGEASGV